MRERLYERGKRERRERELTFSYFLKGLVIVHPSSCSCGEGSGEQERETSRVERGDESCDQTSRRVWIRMGRVLYI